LQGAHQVGLKPLHECAQVEDDGLGHGAGEGLHDDPKVGREDAAERGGVLVRGLHRVRPLLRKARVVGKDVRLLNNDNIFLSIYHV
jgi:hypothetical protein